MSKQKTPHVYLILYREGNKLKVYKGMIMEKSVSRHGEHEAYKRRFEQHESGRGARCLRGRTLLKMVISDKYTEIELAEWTREQRMNHVEWAFDRPSMLDKDWMIERHTFGLAFAVPRFKPFWMQCKYCSGKGETSWPQFGIPSSPGFYKCPDCNGTGGTFF